jgi:hypothetical protein
MTKARFIYLLVVASLLVYFVASNLRFHHGFSGMSQGDG